MRIRDPLLLACLGLLISCQPNQPRAEVEARPESARPVVATDSAQADSSTARAPRRVVRVNHVISDSARATHTGGLPPGPGAVVIARPATESEKQRLRRAEQTPRPEPTPAPDAPLSDDALLAGFMRWDGRVAPFAAFDGQRWRGVSADAFQSRASARPVAWHFSVNGGREMARGGQVVEGATPCAMHEWWAQTTDAQLDTAQWRQGYDSDYAFERARRSCPVDRIGLALSEDLPVAPFTPIDTATVGPVLAVVRRAFERAETERLEAMRRDSTDESRTVSGHPARAAERAGRPIVVTTLQRASAPDGRLRLYFFSAIRRYELLNRGGYSCPVTYVNGFVIDAGGDLVAASPSSGIQGVQGGGCIDSPGWAIRSVRPYGLMEAGGRPFFVASTTVWEGGVPIIYEVTRTGMREVVSGWVTSGL